MKENFLSLIGFLLILLIFITHAVYLNCIAEDAFISFRFAKNLANGHGLVWNIGDSPVEGYTNFLWVILCALGIKSGLNISVFAQSIGLIASIMTLVFAYMFARKIFNLTKLQSLIPPLLLSVSGPFATWAESGMETNLFGMFVLIGCYYFTYSLAYSTKKEMFFAYVAILLATLTRPEGFMVFCILTALSLTFSGYNIKNSIREILYPVISYLLPFSVYFIWRFKYFGYLLPNTYYAKTGGTFYQYLRGGTYVLYFALFFILPFLPLIAIYIWENYKTGSKLFKILTFKMKINSDPGTFVFSVLILFFILYIIFVGGDYMAMYRFFVPILPEIYILLGYIIIKLISEDSFNFKRSTLITALTAIAIAGTLLQSTPMEMKLFKQPSCLNGSYRGLLIEKWHSARLTLIGKFFHDYKKNDDDSLATVAIGAVSYYSDLKIYDQLGLVDPYIAHKKNNDKPIGKGLPGHEKGDLKYLLSKNPTYIMFNRDLTKEKIDIEDDLMRLKFRIGDKYKLTSVWLVDDVNNEEGYFNFLELKI